MLNKKPDPLANMYDAKTALSIITCEDHPKKDGMKICFFCLNLGGTECPHLGQEQKVVLCSNYAFDKSNPQIEKLLMASLRGIV